MQTIKYLFITLVILTLVFSCNSDDDVSETNVNVAFNFTHIWDNQVLDNTSLNTSVVTNASGQQLNFARLRYLVSKFQLTHSNGTVYTFDGYKFTDLEDVNTYNFSPSIAIPTGSYTLSFIWGFNETDNVDGAYPDLNSASWNWPSMLGGGYHFMQFDGSYNLNTNPSPFNFHNGTARVSTNPNVFEQNYAQITFNTPITITANSNIEVVMDMAEFFKNPNTWDLNVFDTQLMPNYTAQKMMQQNVATVFSIGNITNF